MIGNPNPDIRLIAALASADHVLSPIQLNQEAMDGVSALLYHDRVGVRKIKALLNPKLSVIGLLPTLVEATPFQRANLVQVVQKYHPLMIRVLSAAGGAGAVASLPRRSCIAEAQSDGQVLWEMKKSAAHDTWREIEAGLVHIAQVACGKALVPGAGGAGSLGSPAIVVPAIAPSPAVPGMPTLPAWPAMTLVATQQATRHGAAA